MVERDLLMIVVGITLGMIFTAAIARRRTPRTVQPEKPPVLPQVPAPLPPVTGTLEKKPPAKKAPAPPPPPRKRRPIP